MVELLKIEIFVDEKATDLKISVTCKQLSPDIEKILATLRMMDHQLTAKKGAEIYLLDIADVIYIESIDRKCFIYTEQISLMISHVDNLQLEAENICIVIVNMLITVILFTAAYKKCGLA